jgi:hypothetical protein
MDPAIKKRVDFYRGMVLISEFEETRGGGFEVPELADPFVHSLFESDYEKDAIDKARHCFQLDPGNPLHDGMLLLILAHVVFGRGQKRGRSRHSNNWDTLKTHQLIMAYLELKSKYPKLRDAKIAAMIADGKKFGTPADAIRKRLSGLRRHIEYLKRGEDQQQGYIRYVEELLVKGKKDLQAKLSY